MNDIEYSQIDLELRNLIAMINALRWKISDMSPEVKSTTPRTVAPEDERDL